jgi:putative transposase
MILVETHIIKSSHEFYKEFDEIAFLAKNLYNSANYVVRQEFIESSKRDGVGNYIQFFDLNHRFIVENQENYIALPRKISTSILRLVDQNWRSFFTAIRDWKKHPIKYLGRPKLPNYKHKTKGRFVVPYTKQAVSKTQLVKHGIINPSGTSIKIKTKINYEQLQAVRIVPRNGFYVIEILYNKEINDLNLDKNRVIGIDLGVNNLAAIASTDGEMTLINGKPLKSINQFYNKKKARLQSQLPENQRSSKSICRLINRRNRKVDDYLHKASRKIINLCIEKDFGTIVIGRNKNWKNELQLGKRNNQNFVQIPFFKFINMVKYKAELVGIQVVETEESYTSKCSFLDDEPLEKHEVYKGKRVKRGLFKSLTNKYLNADINGAFNIIRKVIPTFSYASVAELWNTGCGVHPTLLKV